MATTVQALSALAAPATGDILYIEDVSDTSESANGTGKKITLANLLAGVQQFYNVKDYGATGDGTTDDTAAIQAALDAINGTVGQEFGGVILFPSGTYLISDTLVVKGPNVTLQGTGRRSTWIELTDSSKDGIHFAVAGTKVPHNPRLIGFTLRASRTGTVTGTGVSTERQGDPTPDEYWFSGLKAVDVDVIGFDVCWLATNHPHFQLHSCTFVAITTGVELVKCDTFGIYHCQGSYGSDRDSSQLFGTNSTVFKLRDATGTPSGRNFAGIIDGGEYGNCQHFIDNESGYLTVRNCNTETYSGTWTIRHRTGTLEILNCRFANGGAASSDAIILFECTANGPILRILGCVKPSNAAKEIVVTGASHYYARVITDWPVNYENPLGTQIGYQQANPLLIESRNATWWGSIAPDTSVGNGLFKDQILTKFKRSGVAERSDKLASYTDEADVWRRSSIINDNLGRVLDRQSALSSAAGGGESTLWTKSVEAYTLAIGNELRLVAHGTFAANANNKRLRVTFAGASRFDSGTVTHNNKSWSLELRVYGRNGSELRFCSVFAVDGEPVVVQTSTQAATITQARSMELLTTGTDAGDVTIDYAKIFFRQ